MECTRSPYRPNVRRLTSPRAQRRIKWDILSAWAGALAVSLSLWAAFFHLMTR